MHASKAVLAVEKKFQRTDLPQFRAGDTIKVHAKIKEGAKERIQIVEGLCIKLNGNGITRAFTIRKMSSNVGVELVYPLCSPKVAKIEVVNRAKVRRGRIYYLRNLRGKAARLKSLDNKKK